MRERSAAGTGPALLSTGRSSPPLALPGQNRLPTITAPATSANPATTTTPWLPLRAFAFAATSTFGSSHPSSTTGLGLATSTGGAGAAAAGAGAGKLTATGVTLPSAHAAEQ